MAEGDKSLGETLLELGWHQGVLFKVKGIKFTYNRLLDNGDFTIVSEELNENQSLILISQDCDITSSLPKETLVDALICELWEKNKLAACRSNQNDYHL